MKATIDRARALQSLVAEHADHSEAQRHLCAAVAQAFASSGLYRIAAPKDCFGSEQDPQTQIETIEAIAQIDGSAAWNLMIGIESFGLMAPGFERCRDLIEDPSVIVCGSTAAVGRAEQVPGGYRVSGRWPFVSGCHNSALFGATVQLWANGELLRQGNRYAMVPAPDFQILDTWQTGGLRGSGSHDVVLEDVFVPEERIVRPLGAVPHSAPLLRFPVGSRLAYNKVAVATGIAQAGLTAFKELAAGKVPRFASRRLRQRGRAQRAIAEAQVRVLAARTLVVSLVNQLWEQVLSDNSVNAEDRALFQIACSDAVRGCVQAVDKLVEAAGTSANAAGQPLERICRDIRVIGQHASVAPHHIEDGGRVLLGLPAEELMLAGLGNSAG